MFQLRYHPIQEQIKALAKQLNQPTIQLSYRGNRDQAYFTTWKGNLEKSGGILAAIGIHLFDLLFLNFGGIQEIIHLENGVKNSTGKINLENATVEWDFEFVTKEKIPVSRTFRINEHQLDIGSYANNLHSVAYQEILNGNGIDLQSVKEGIKLLNTVFTL